jgi:hypothetical protein
MRSMYYGISDGAETSQRIGQSMPETVCFRAPPLCDSLCDPDFQTAVSGQEGADGQSATNLSGCPRIIVREPHPFALFVPTLVWCETISKRQARDRGKSIRSYWLAQR